LVKHLETGAFESPRRSAISCWFTPAIRFVWAMDALIELEWQESRDHTWN
jgi:hypothetical protein